VILVLSAAQWQRLAAVSHRPSAATGAHQDFQRSGPRGLEPSSAAVMRYPASRRRMISASASAFTLAGVVKTMTMVAGPMALAHCDRTYRRTKRNPF